jgi:SPP1 family predicted phage head-tail adaptor
MAEMILAGTLRHRVTIQAPQDARTNSGATKTVFVDYLGPIWASVEPLTARELWAAAQVQSEATVRIRIRYRPGITAKMRVKWQRIPGSPNVYDWYEIEGPPIDIEGRHHELHLMCVLREAEGFRQGAPS